MRLPGLIKRNYSMGCTTVKERYTPVAIGANASVTFDSQSMGGFLAITDGTITVYRKRPQGGDEVIVNTLPVTGGIYYPIPIYLNQNGGRVVLASGASGVLCL